ncbi:Complement C3 [Bagarius yarrelli]|uniref:Complement C3 n=1 Tax=Bagarius yarrelli TaxID=175774 RepID=A0A556TL87_BAGYA|nr:Complement C3 [Bagarius yarrelli]
MFLLLLFSQLTIFRTFGNEWSGNYSQENLCALEGSTVFINITYTHPTKSKVTNRFWAINPVEGKEPTDLREEPGYSGRVEYLEGGQNQFSLRLSDVKKTDERMYSVRIQETKRSDNDLFYPAVTLSVTDLKVESPDEVVEGNETVFVCSTTCRLSNSPSYIWYKNGHRINTNQNKMNTLTLQPTKAEHIGSYTCAVTGYEQLCSPARTLSVQYRPKNVSVSISPSGNILKGSSVTLTCSGYAYPPVETYLWFKEATLVKKGKTYNISRISSEDSGEYKCKCINKEHHIAVRPLVSSAPQDNQEEIPYANIAYWRNSKGSPSTNPVLYTSIQHGLEAKEVQYSTVHSSSLHKNVLVAPNLLRVGTPEKVFVEAQDYKGGNVPVRISVKDFPKKNSELTWTLVELTAETYFQAVVDITIPESKDFSDDPLEKQYVYLQAEFPSKTLEKVVLLSFQSGYIFVQTDKSIYTPGTEVQYRIFSVTPELQPVDTQKGITVQVINPQGVIIEQKTVKLMVKTFTYNIPVIAMYLFGKDVNGVAFVVFGVKTDKTKSTLSASLTRAQIDNGEGQAELTRDMIRSSFPDINKLVGSSLYISVSVFTGKTPTLTSIPKPYVYVTNPDHSPAGGVDLLVKPHDVYGKTNSNGLAKVLINSQNDERTIHINARTADPGILQKRQSENNMTVQAYNHKEGSTDYLHLSVEATELKINEQLNLNIFFKSRILNHDLTYLVLSKGQIVLGKRFERKGNSHMTLSLPVNKDLVPSFRVVAYYHTDESEVVSDSIWVDVQDTCMGKLSLDLNGNSKRIFAPGQEFQLKVTGDPGAKVGLVAVNKAVFVLNKNRLTQKKIWDIVEKHDTGCTAGGGKDSMGVFYDAGLLFESDQLGGTSERTVGKYASEQKKCCADGLKQNRLGYTCERRATFILDGAECVQAFLDCCREVQKRKSEQKELLHLARSEDTDDDEFFNFDDEEVRWRFDESWLWHDIELPACEKNQKCHTTSHTLPKNALKDSITTWQVLAISLSKTHGICVADPYEITVAKDFFVDLKLPYSAVRNEQIEIKAVLHNLSNMRQRVRVDFFETDHVCSAASKKMKYRTMITMDEMSTLSIPYVIIPMEIGEPWIEVHATASNYQDKVKRSLKVVSEGKRIELLVQNVELNPSRESGGVQFVNVMTDIPEGHIPNSPANTFIIVTGQEITQTIEQAISGDFMGRLIVQPNGCGEQNMIFMTLPLIATHYLDTTNQWDKVGLNRRTEAIKFIQTGYNQQLAFRKTDGSYAAWIHRPSSTWLTAYVAKVFALASDFASIEDEILCSAIKWLILNAQMPDGFFKENAPVYHAEMVGDVQGKDADASLTAFVLIALQEGDHLCAGSVRSLTESSNKAIKYLENRLPTMTNPYAIAMTSYALANAGKFNKQRLLQSSTEDGTYWKTTGGHYFSLEATAYALLALVKAKEFEAARKVVRWLNRQSSPYGGYETTQATIIVFQAVAEYYIQKKQVGEQDNIELKVKLSVSGRKQSFEWTINKINALHTRSEKIPLKKEFNVTAYGTGTGVLKVITIYYAKPIEKKNDCQKYNLTVKMTQEEEVSYLGASESYEVVIDVLYKDLNRDATMTILDFGLLTGFVVDENDLKDLTSGKDKYIQKFEIDKQLSERGSLIMYLDKVSHTFPDRVAFRMHKMNNVAWLQPAAVRVYEYYSPEKNCVKFYHPVKEDGALDRLCIEQKDLCQCAEENCSIQKKEKISENERDKKACAAGMDYVYKVKLLNLDHRQNTDYYKVKIEEVLKEGSDRDVEDKTRIFMGHPNCRESFKFILGKSYLIMGQSADLPRIDGELQYILGERTWIEYWPTEQEGQTAEFSNKYAGISKLSYKLGEFGCTT